MDYDTRKKLLFSYLASPKDGMLTRYKRPEHLSDDAAREEVNDLVEDLNSKIPQCDKEKFYAILGRFKVNLRQLVSSRYWPNTPQCIKAMKAAVEDTPASTAFNEDDIIAKMAKAFRDGVKCPAHLATEALTRKVHDQHGFNLWDLYATGFPMDANLKSDMRDQPKGEKYLKHHYGALARIWGCSLDEAKARDQQNVSSGMGVQPDELDGPQTFGGKY